MNKLEGGDFIIFETEHLHPITSPNTKSMENKQFGCEELNPSELQQINGGGYLSDVLTLGKGIYFLTKGFVATVPLAGALANSLLTSFADPVVTAL